MTNSKIKALVESLTAEIEAQIRASALDAVTKAFGGAVALPAVKADASKPAAKKASKKKPAKAKNSRTPKATPAKAAKSTAAKAAKAPQRSPADRDRDVGRLVAHVRANPGTTTEKARAALGIEKGPWKVAMGHAIDTKQLSKKGERRESTLHLG